MACLSWSVSCLNDGIMRLPPCNKALIWSSLYLEPTLMSDGKLPVPFLSCPWHPMQLLVNSRCPAWTKFSDFGASFCLESIMVITHAISLALMYNKPVVGSYAGPPHSAPPSNPGKIIEGI